MNSLFWKRRGESSSRRQWCYRMECLYHCTSPACGVRIELEFSISAFLDSAKPRVLRGVVESAERQGWFLLTGTRAGDLWFRLPAVEDQMSVIGRPEARQLLANRCIESQRRNAPTIAAAERAMEAMAPPVSKAIEGVCPECGEKVTMPLHVPTFVLQELRMSAAGIYAEIHVIAKAYHWDETSILVMPPSRRQAYVDAIRSGQKVN